MQSLHVRVGTKQSSLNLVPHISAEDERIISIDIAPNAQLAVSYLSTQKASEKYLREIIFTKSHPGANFS
jgi:hypothetical protein